MFIAEAISVVAAFFVIWAKLDPVVQRMPDLPTFTGLRPNPSRAGSLSAGRPLCGLAPVRAIIIVNATCEPSWVSIAALSSRIIVGKQSRTRCGSRCNRMDTVSEALGTANVALSLVDKMIGPWLTRRQSVADAEARIVGALADQVADHINAHPHSTELQDALISLGGKWNLTNFVKMLQAAVPQLDADARPDLIADDWAANFKDKARTCSDPEMAELWAQLLAGEGNKPGSYSRKTVNVLSDMDKSDAQLFSDLCRFQLMGYSDEMWRFPAILDIRADIYGKFGITSLSLSALQSLGLIEVAGSPNGGIRLANSIQCNFLAHSEGILIFHRRDDSDRLSSVGIGSVSFSRTGQEMSNLCLPLRTPHGFVDWLIARWEQGQTQFTVEKRGRSVNFLDLRATVRPDLGRIVTSDPVLPT